MERPTYLARPAIKQARDWRLNERVVVGLARQPIRAGRPLAPEMAWAVLLNASGDLDAAARMLDHPRDRSRAQSWLRDHPLPEHASRLRLRARGERFDIHPAEVPRLLARGNRMRGGRSAPEALALVGGSDTVEAYAPASAREAIIDEHALQTGDGPCCCAGCQIPWGRAFPTRARRRWQWY